MGISSNTCSEIYIEEARRCNVGAKKKLEDVYHRILLISLLGPGGVFSISFLKINFLANARLKLVIQLLIQLIPYLNQKKNPRCQNELVLR